MADRWMDERDEDRRERESRDRDRYERATREGRPSEARSFGNWDRVFGERKTGMGYNRGPDTTRPAWQDRDYTGVSPAMQHGEYDVERRRLDRERATGGSGRFDADDRHERTYDASSRGQPGDFGRGAQGYPSRAGGSLWPAGPAEPFGPPSGSRGASADGGRHQHHEHGEPGDFFSRAGERISNWFGNTADEVRRDFRGASEVRHQEAVQGHRGRGPQGYQRTDERISDDAHQRLTDDPWLDASAVSLSVNAGEVTLSGTVENREAKHRAERLVEDLSGVNHVQNNLRISSGVSASQDALKSPPKA